MAKTLLSSLLLAGAVFVAAPSFATDPSLPGCGDEVKKPKDGSNPPKASVPLCGGDKKPETPPPPKDAPKT